MKHISKLYTTITLIQISVTFTALSVSSLGVVIEHASLIYFWYLALGGITMILATSFVIGIALAFTRSIRYLRRARRIGANPAVGIS